jgi:hypothetical protein
MAGFQNCETISVHARYGFLENSILNMSGVGTQGHASFDDGLSIQGSHDFDHHNSYQAAVSYGSTGTAQNVATLFSAPMQSAGTILALSHIHILDILQTGGTTAKQYGIHIENLASGAENYAIFQEPAVPPNESAPSLLSGKLMLGYLGSGAFITHDRSTGTTTISSRANYPTKIVEDQNVREWDIGVSSAAVQHVYLGVVQAQFGGATNPTWIGAATGTSGADAAFYFDPGYSGGGLLRIPYLKSNSGGPYVCVDSLGQLYSRAVCP